MTRRTNEIERTISMPDELIQFAGQPWMDAVERKYHDMNTAVSEIREGNIGNVENMPIEEQVHMIVQFYDFELEDAIKVALAI